LRRTLKTGLILLTLLMIGACNPARKLADGNYLLVKNKLSLKNKYADAGEVSSFIKQEKIRKQLGTYLGLRIYNLFNKGKDNKSKAWIRNTLGTDPVILDTSLVDQSVRQISLYLDSKGYFNSKVERTIDYNYKKKKNHAMVHYKVVEAPPYFIRNISYTISDPTLSAFIHSDKPRTLIKSGAQYDADVLIAERQRMTDDLHNLGYYYFDANFIHYKIDSSLGTHQLDIKIEVADPMVASADRPDSLVKTSHKRYYIKDTYIMVDPEVTANSNTKYDTLKVVVPHRKKNNPPRSYFFVYKDKLKIKPKTITQQIFIDSGDFYRYRDVEKTHKQLYELRVFRSVNIMFEDQNAASGPGLLNCKINISRLPIQAFAAETQITNRGGNLGTSASLVYANRNLFRGAELLQFKLNGAFEIEKLSLSTSKEERAIEGIPFFNTIELGTEANLRIPKFILPVRQEKFSKNFRPKTNISLGFNYQQRADFTRYISKASFGYEWKESNAKTHYLIPLELNSVIINPDSTFSQLIEAMPDKIMQNTYKDHIISSIKYSYIYNTQEVGRNNNFMYFRGNFEVAGFLFWLYNSLRGKHGAYSLFDIPYSQFVRVDLDYRYYAYFKGNNSIATRAAIGMGAPLTSKNVLPFEKYFYLGGSNSMRGWRLRTLGPGSYDESDTVRVDNIGDIGLEMNFEYRFPIYKYFKGGFFIDAGNVWLRSQNDLYPGGEFSFKRFYKEIAFDAGLGLRLDFGFFLVRLDGAIPLKDPRMPEGERWVFQNDRKIKILGNLGIGYPF
jgi:outer membrane protein assembly factor BamA